MARGTFWSRGVPFIWGTGSMVIFALLMLAGMMGLILVKGLGHYWPAQLHQLETSSGDSYLGLRTDHEEIPFHGAGPQTPIHRRTQYRIGSRDIYGLDFRWFEDSTVVNDFAPELAVAIEREGHGEMYGFIQGAFTEGGHAPSVPGDAFGLMQKLRRSAAATAREIHREETEISDLYQPLNRLERLLKAARVPERLARPGGLARVQELASAVDRTRAQIEPEVQKRHEAIAARKTINEQRYVQFALAGGQVQSIPLAEILRAWQPNRMSLPEKLQHYLAGVWIFVAESPREANTGGGIFPAIYGTILMVLLMTVAVVPLGVVAALYLHEYARDNWFVRMVRMAVNNLAGVPSIVFGVFGLGFFVYFVGAGIDRTLFADYLPSPTFGTGGILWASLTLALLTVPVVIVATEEGLAAVPRAYRDGSLALGATKFQTIRKIVIPYATPGILTGVILAVSRGAGEVAPLMLTGVVPLVSEYPLSTSFPFLHLDRKFMHLGFHIYDVGFQSPNVEAVKPLVYSTTLVLVLLVVLLNAAAIILRGRLRKRARGSRV